MSSKLISKVTLTAMTTAVLSAGIGSTSNAAESDKAAAADYTKMSPEALAEHLIFKAKGFKLEQPAQEGGLAGKRLEQDETQKICTVLRGKAADAETAEKVTAMARDSIRYPEGGIQLGDWKIGRELAWSGFGYRIGHKNDDHSGAKNGPGGNCYNCHQLATDRTGGNIGPTLTGYGKLRGTSEAILKYTYDVIYNANAYFPCTHMPRMGANGMLSSEQISHIMAYLLDPESPVNK